MKRVVVAVTLSVLSLALGEVATTLDIYFIDVEGGQSTLIVTPTGESLLIDAGYGRRIGRGQDTSDTLARDPERILAATRAAHVDHIDYLLITHFHPDHAGGVPELASKIPIGTFIDYGAPLGTDRMATGVYRTYEPARASHPHLVPAPGDRLPIRGIDADIVSVDGLVLSKPIEGAGQENAACSTVEDQEPDGTENFRSLGVRIQFGAFRFLDLGDLMGNTLASTVCPRNLLGEADAYLVPHHGDYDANVPAVLAAVKPRVAIMNNGATKGGDPASFATLHRQPELEDVWQLHASNRQGAANSPDQFIANVDDGQTSHWIKLTATSNGDFTIVNGRTGFTKTYAERDKRTVLIKFNPVFAMFR